MPNIFIDWYFDALLTSVTPKAKALDAFAEFSGLR
jgi:hypothetical protein